MKAGGLRHLFAVLNQQRTSNTLQLLAIASWISSLELISSPGELEEGTPNRSGGTNIEFGDGG